MRNKLEVASNLHLPLEFVTETQAILAMKRVGKTYTASVEAEELLKLGQQIVVVDPTGAWWGLKSSADGKSAGFSIPVFGGEHADVPLEEHAGAVIAQAVIEHRFSAILDLSLLRKGAMKRFMASFLDELYHRNREAMHLFVDEADMFAPQKPFKGDELVLGAMEDIVRRGGVKGIGCTLITQRPSVLNKDVLTQCGILVTLRMNHPRDIAPISEWVNEHGDTERMKEMRASLPALPKGTAWFWAPGFDIFKRVEIRERETFNSSITPKPGERVRKPKTAAAIDLNQLGEQIQATVQQAKENDPKQLQARVRELTNANLALASKQVEAKTVQVEKIVEVPVALKEDIELLKSTVQSLLDNVQDELNEARTQLNNIVAKIPAPRPAKTLVGLPKEVLPASQSRVEFKTVVRRAPVKPQEDGQVSGNLGQGEVAVLKVVSQYPKGATRQQITINTGYKRSTRNTYIQRLRVKGFILEEGELVYITQEGMNELGDRYESLPKGKALQQYWLQRLPEGESKILSLLLIDSPQGLSRDEISQLTGYARSSRNTYIQRLSSRLLVQTHGEGFVKASAELFN